MCDQRCKVASVCAGPDGQTASVYERAMAAFGAIMQFYDPLRSFPLWGFGGQVCPPWPPYIFFRGEDIYVHEFMDEGVKDVYPAEQLGALEK